MSAKGFSGRVSIIDDPETRARIVARIMTGDLLRDIAPEFGVSVGTISRWAGNLGLRKKPERELDNEAAKPVVVVERIERKCMMCRRPFVSLSRYVFRCDPCHLRIRPSVYDGGRSGICDAVEHSVSWSRL